MEKQKGGFLKRLQNPLIAGAIALAGTIAYMSIFSGKDNYKQEEPAAERKDLDIYRFKTADFIEEYRNGEFHRATIKAVLKNPEGKKLTMDFSVKPEEWEDFKRKADKDKNGLTQEETIGFLKDYSMRFNPADYKVYDPVDGYRYSGSLPRFRDPAKPLD